MTNSHTINDTSTALKPQEELEEGQGPSSCITATRKGRRSIALCGQPIHSGSVTFVRKARKAGETLVCPMCELEAERQDRRKHDPDEPSFPVAVGLGLRWLIEDAGMTACDVADKTGLDAGN